MRKLSALPRASKKPLGPGANGARSKNGAPDPPAPKPIFKYPKTELEAAIQRYVDLFDFAPIGYVTFDRVGRIEEINLTASGLLGRARRQLVGGSFAVCVAKLDTQLFLNHLLRCRSSDGHVKTELHLKTPEGMEFPVLLSSTPTSSSMKDGALLYQTAIIDLTERVRTEKELRESEERHRAIVSQSTVGMAHSNLNGQLMFVNRTLCEILGYREESELIGKTVLEITHPDDIAESKRLFHRIMQKGHPYQLEKRYLRKDGSQIWVSVSASPTRDADGKTKSAVAVILDISKRKKAEEALRESRLLLESRVRERTAELLAANEELKNQIAQRKQLEGEIIEISDREQRRMGQDLHDSLCQHLTAVAFMTRAVAHRLKDHRVVEVADLDKIAELINEGVTEARAIARGLHPVDVDSAGLVTALHGLATRKRGQTRCVVETDDGIRISDATISLNLFRIALEAVNNANKHARAHEVVVRMRRLGKQLELSVTDDGVGIPPDADSSTGMGFHIMHYRARSIGARLEIQPSKPLGTRVVVQLAHK